MRCIITVIALLILSADSHAQGQRTYQTPVKEGYTIMSYDARTHQYTIHRNFFLNGKPAIRKLVVRCISYQWGKHPTLHDDLGSEGVCELPIGAFYPAGFAAQKTDWGEVLVTEQATYFAIAEGKHGGPLRTYQAFDVVSSEVLQK